MLFRLRFLRHKDVTKTIKKKRNKEKLLTIHVQLPPPELQLLDIQDFKNAKEIHGR